MKAPLTTSEIREAFLKYFESQGHARVASAGLVPGNDPTLMFTAAGMVQFKDCFLGVDKRSYSRATTAQKCLRAGGKHNDLENVGFTSRHHTFFEMLGNFSFGDYFKEDAIRYAWEFSTKVLGLPPEKLRVSVHLSDDEAARIWEKVTGWKEEAGSREGKGKIVRFDADNFWSAGDVGPCGPCTEIFYDQGEEVDGDRWLEFWNNVFMQYDRDASGKMTPLPKPSVDTGMGLERIASILQGRARGKWLSNYDIDLMEILSQATAELVEKRAKKKIAYKEAGHKISWEVAALRVIVDHLRATSFLIADGVLPSNEGRGYVLRRILRRAVRFGKQLGLEKPFLADLCPALVTAMGEAYPELKSRQSVVVEVLRQEEERFFETLDRGLGLLDETFFKMGSSKTLPADVCFRLYDTYGFPLDLTALIAKEKGYSIDQAGFDKLMQEQQERSRQSWKGSGETAVLGAVKEWKSKIPTPTFVGYETALVEKAKVTAVAPGEQGAWLALDRTPFYGEGGGQIGDRGTLKAADGKVYRVLDSQKPYDGGLAVYVQPAGLKVGDVVRAEVDPELRAATKANHTATHLLHSALREILGTHVQQAGSLVTSEKLRFDFSHSKAITPEELQKIEDWVNRAIETETDVSHEEMSLADAQKKGALALFSEKYGDRVRVLDVPGLSVEFCGGTHVSNTGEIRLFKILSDSAVAAGTRRVEAVTRSGAIGYYKSQAEALGRLAQTLKAPAELVEDRVAKLLDRERSLEKEIEKLRRQLAQGGSAESALKGSFQGSPLEVHVLEGADAKLLREKGDAVRKANPKAMHVILAEPLVLVTVDSAQLPNAHAGNFLKELTQALGGRGGGQQQTAQGQVQTGGGGAQKILEWAQAR
jgi:alanyl-tRNA synthetase